MADCSWPLVIHANKFMPPFRYDGLKSRDDGIGYECSG